MARILIIDDDEAVCRTLLIRSNRLGHNTDFAFSLKEGLEAASSTPYDVVFLDVRLPDGNGLEALPNIRKSTGSPEVIIITGEGDSDGAEMAIRCGAWNYLEKPPSSEAITLSLIRALQYREEKETPQPFMALDREGIIGSSSSIRACLDLVSQAAQSNVNVLITGETGTGKELFANAVHNNSPRSQNNFVIVDCAALPQTLVESVLFGHEKGAFTGADKPHKGLVEQANKGTLFLDEVGELPMPIQKTFLRVLQEHRFRPVGGQREIDSDFRMIAATNRDLDQLVASGKFRADLLFRIRSIVIDLAPLRDRIEDVRETAMYHMNKICDRYGMPTKGFSPEFIESLMDYEWPGNVRELVNTMEGILTTAVADPILYPMHLPDNIRIKMAREAFRKKPKTSSEQIDDFGLAPAMGKFKEFREKILANAEKQYLQNLMSLTRWHIQNACRMSGLSRARLYALLKKHHISRG
jgi:two-component system, NtrC family, response regulator